MLVVTPTQVYEPNALSHELCVAMRCVLCSGLVSRRHVLRGDALPDRQLLGEAPDAATAALHTHTHTRARARPHTAVAIPLLHRGTAVACGGRGLTAIG